MPQFRMPFGRKPQAVPGSIVNDGQTTSNALPSPYDGDKIKTSVISIKARPSEPEEFKLGLVDCNGEYLPPSPPAERRSMWRRPTSSTAASSHRSIISDNDGFSISRESFDSYRRSFDISAKSAVVHPQSSFSRHSLDSFQGPYTPLSTRQNSGRSFESPHIRDVDTVDEEDPDVFEEVGLEDTYKPQKKGIFSRFIKEDHANGALDSSNRLASSHRGFHLPGRKRGQSGQGAELGDMSPPMPPQQPYVEDISAARTQIMSSS